MGILDEQQISAELARLDGWIAEGAAITKRYEFDSFLAAMTFMATAAPRIDALDHHPEWTNVYNRIDVRLTSHDAGGVTERDITLARTLDELNAAS